MNNVKGTLRPLGNKVFVKHLERGERTTASGLVLSNDVGKSHGIRDRWAQVWLVGPDVYDLVPGDWIYVEHGRWSVGIDYENDDGSIEKFWIVDYPNAVSIKSDVCPFDFTYENLNN